jgi:hypothetical protein
MELIRLGMPTTKEGRKRRLSSPVKRRIWNLRIQKYKRICNKFRTCEC